MKGTTGTTHTFAPVQSKSLAHPEVKCNAEQRQDGWQQQAGS